MSERQWLGCSALLGHGPVGSCFLFLQYNAESFFFFFFKSYRNQGNEKGAELEVLTLEGVRQALSSAVF